MVHRLNELLNIVGSSDCQKDEFSATESLVAAL